MVTLNTSNDTTRSEGWEFRGKSTDTKPSEVNGVNIPNGSVFFEFDTGDVYFWDDDSKTWISF